MTMLLIPIDSPLTIIQEHQDPLEVMGRYGGKGQPITLTVGHPEHPTCKVWAFVDPVYSGVNPRARRALELLAAVHMVFTGPVLFTDLEASVADDLMESL